MNPNEVAKESSLKQGCVCLGVQRRFRRGWSREEVHVFIFVFISAQILRRDIYDLSIVS